MLCGSLLWCCQARDKARKDAAQFAADSLEKLSDMTKTPTSQLKFVMDAWKQVRSAAGKGSRQGCGCGVEARGGFGILL